MISTKQWKKTAKNNKGFTIVELLIVIVVIGILALLVVTTYSGIQTKARNNKRAADMQAVQTQLEAYYQSDNSGHYPSLANMNDSSWRGTNMKSLDDGALADPSDPGDKTLVGTPAAKVYAYQPVQTDGSSCAADANLCAKYTLTATYEGTVNGSTTVVKKSLE
jgi:prepilin-type N-terminal cleavage/methylation domain-containing protein